MPSGPSGLSRPICLRPLGGQTTDYDLADRLNSITAPDGSIVSFSIDALGRHATQTVGSSPTSTYSYLGASDSITTIANTAGTTYSTIDAIGDRLATGSGTSLGWIVPDLHGNVAAAIACPNGSAPTFVNAFRFDPYGGTVATWTASTGSVSLPWRYQGRILESAGSSTSTDLYDFGARSYDPSLGAFTSFDSVSGSAANPLTLNRYLYANGNPATLVDPDGHWATMRDEGRDPTQGRTIIQVRARALVQQQTALRNETRRLAILERAEGRDAIDPWYQHEEAQRECTAHGLNAAGACEVAHSNAGLGPSQFQKDPIGSALFEIGGLIGGSALVEVSLAGGGAVADLLAAGGAAAAGAAATGTGTAAETAILACEEDPECYEVLDPAAGSAASTLDTAGATVGTAASSGANAEGINPETLQSIAEACPLSFTATTAVATTGGTTAIAAIKVGDTVLAYDPKTGETGPHTVSEVMAHTDPVIEHLATDTGAIDTTPNHPFFTTDRGWVLAGSLQVGEQVRTETGGSATILGFTTTATPTTMWDLTVDGAHSFFVGQGAVLVHNAGPCGSVRVLGSYPLYTKVAEAIDGGRAFSVPEDIWNEMSADEQWAANRTFLDRGISNGDPFLVATGGRPWGAGLNQEVNYLLNNGYDWTSNGLGLVPTP